MNLLLKNKHTWIYEEILGICDDYLLIHLFLKFLLKFSYIFEIITQFAIQIITSCIIKTRSSFIPAFSSNLILTHVIQFRFTCLTTNPHSFYEMWFLIFVEFDDICKKFVSSVIFMIFRCSCEFYDFSWFFVW